MKIWIKYVLIAISLVVAFVFGRQSSDYQLTKKTDQPTENIRVKNRDYKPSISSSNSEATDNEVPQKVIDVLKYIRTYNKAPDNYVGGRRFQNREQQLPISDNDNQKIQYREWDVNPKIEGQNRGAQRLVTSDKKAYYTEDHYKSFVEIKEE